MSVCTLVSRFELEGELIINDLFFYSLSSCFHDSAWKGESRRVWNSWETYWSRSRAKEISTYHNQPFEIKWLPRQMKCSGPSWTCLMVCVIYFFYLNKKILFQEEKFYLLYRVSFSKRKNIFLDHHFLHSIKNNRVAYSYGWWCWWLRWVLPMPLVTCRESNFCSPCGLYFMWWPDCVLEFSHKSHASSNKIKH